MARVYQVPPKTDEETIIGSLNKYQLAWGAGGVLFGFINTALLSAILGTNLFTVLLGVLSGFACLPFMFYKPMERSMTYFQYLRRKYSINKRNNFLVNISKTKFTRSEAISSISVQSSGTSLTANQSDVKKIDVTL